MPPKKQTKKKNDDWDDDAAEKKLAENLAAVRVDAEEDVAWDEESDDEPPPPPPKAGRAAAFGMLMDDESDDESVQSEPEVVEVKPEPVKKQQPEKKAPPKNEPKQDKQKAKKVKKNQEDEDLDALLAEFDKPAEKPGARGKNKKETKENTEATIAPDSEVTKDTAEAVEPKAEDLAVEDEDAGKKKKKKKKDKKKGAAIQDGAEDVVEPSEMKDADGNEVEDDEGADEKDKKKKKKKKDKKKVDKEDEPEGKGKKKGHVSLIKEMLRAKAQAEEEAKKKAQEEEERLDALEKAREEAERIAREKREAEKERKKALIEKQKAEGTYLTAKQKEQQRIAMAKLAAAGLQLPSAATTGAATGERKPVVYLDKRALKKQQAREAKKQQEQASAEGSATATPGTASPAPEVEKETAESWDADDEPNEAQPSIDQEEALDDWEMADVEDIKLPVSKPDIAKLVKKESAEQEGEAESSSDDESGEESSEESSSEEESSEEEAARGNKESKEQIIERVKARIKKRKEAAEAKRSVDNLRAPVICVLGHVDTGKTKMLDTIRRTNVQDGEAGGITQQIGATEVPGEAIKERCKQVRDFLADAMRLPSFLIIDTPGHESFSNLRSRGESLCDFAILVVDIMHGLEQQTLESLKMLLKRQTPFVIALNKIDRLYGYESNPRKDVYQHLKSQPNNTQLEFKDRYAKTVLEFAEQGVNVCLSNNNKDVNDYISMVPTSAMLGDGIGNLMAYIVNSCQEYHAKKLSYSEELDASVMEVKSLPGLGTTVDIILVNGKLKKNDILVLTGTDGPIVTPIRDLLTPQPLRDVRVVKSDFIHHSEIRGAQGVKVLAKDMEKVVAGLPVYVANDEDELDVLMMEAEAQLSRALHAIKKKPEGVYVQASTLGSLEALLEFLKSQKIPYSNVNIGPVHKKDVQKASTMKDHKAEYACILAFDVKIEREAQLFADREGVKIFQADIIYHLEDNFLKYREELRQQARKENEHKAIFPCRLRVLPQHIFNARNPIVCGVSVEAGQLKRGTPICIPSKDRIFIGTVSSLQRNQEEVPLAKKGDEVCIKIENTTGEAPKLYGRHFTHEDLLVSMITRDSIDACKDYFREDLTKEDWQLVVKLKKDLDIL